MKYILNNLVLNRLPAKNNFKEYRKLISGKVEYEGPNPIHSEFFGYLRLKKDPKMEKLTIDNFIPRGAKLKYCDWYKNVYIIITNDRVFGLVVFTGNDTKIMLSSNYGRHKMSLIESNVNFYFLCFGIILMILSIVIPFF